MANIQVTLAFNTEGGEVVKEVTVDLQAAASAEKQAQDAMNQFTAGLAQQTAVLQGMAQQLDALPFLLDKVGESGSRAGHEAGGGLSEIAEQGKKLLETIGIMVGIREAIDFMKESLAAVGQKQDALTGLNFALASSGHYSAEAAADLVEFAEGLSKTSTESVGALVHAEAYFASIGTATEKIKPLTQASADLAAHIYLTTGRQIDATESALQLGRAIETGAGRQLTQMGLTVDKNATPLERMNSLLDQIQRLMAGDAAAAAQTYTGQMKQLHNAWEEMQVSFGLFLGSITSSDKPFGSLIQNVNSLSHWIRVDLIGAFDEAKVKFDGFILSIQNSAPLAAANFLGLSRVIATISDPLNMLGARTSIFGNGTGIMGLGGRVKDDAAMKASIAAAGEASNKALEDALMQGVKPGANGANRDLADPSAEKRAAAADKAQQAVTKAVDAMMAETAKWNGAQQKSLDETQAVADGMGKTWEAYVGKRDDLNNKEIDAIHALDDHYNQEMDAAIKAKIPTDALTKAHDEATQAILAGTAAQQDQLTQGLSPLETKQESHDAAVKSGTEIAKLYNEEQARQAAFEKDAATQNEAYDKAVGNSTHSLSAQVAVLEDQHAKYVAATEANGHYSDAEKAALENLNATTTAILEQKAALDFMSTSLDTVGSGLSKLGLGGAGGLASGFGGITKALSSAGGLTGLGGSLSNMFSSSDGTGDTGPTAGGGGIMQLAQNFMGGLSKAMPIAAAAMGVFNAISSIFGSKPEYEQVADQLGKTLGAHITDATAKAIAATESTDKVDRAVAIAMNASRIITDVGLTKQSFDIVGQLMKGIADGAVPAAKGEAELDKVFTQVQQSSPAAATAMIIQAKALNEQLTPAMQKAVDAANALEATGASEINAGLGMMDTKGLGIDTAVASTWGTDAAQFFVTGFQAEIGTKGLVGALDAESKNFQSMYSSLTNSGNTAAAALLAPYAQLMATFEGSDTSLKGMVTTLEGEQKVFEGVTNQGMLSNDTFATMERSISQVSTTMAQYKVTGTTSLQAIHGELQDVITASQQYGYPIDAATQKLIDQSKAAGLAFKTDPIVALTGSINDLVTALDKAFGLTKNLGGAMSALPGSAPPGSSSTGTYTAPTAGGTSTTGGAPTWIGGANYMPPHLGVGGLVTQPTLALVGESGPELVLPMNAYPINLPQPLAAAASSLRSPTSSTPTSIVIQPQVTVNVVGGAKLTPEDHAAITKSVAAGVAGGSAAISKALEDRVKRMINGANSI